MEEGEGAVGGEQMELYREGLRAQRRPGDEAEAMKVRMVELLTRHPDDARLWMQAGRSLWEKSAGAKGKDLAESMEAVLNSLGDQILPAD